MSLKKVRVTHPEVPEPPPETWSNCLVVGQHVYISGLTAWDGEQVVGIGSTREQTKHIFEQTRKLLSAADAHIDDIVKMVIYVTNIEDKFEVWKARREFFSGIYPASTLVEISALFRPEILVEIDLVGIIGARTAP